MNFICTLRGSSEPVSALCFFKNSLISGHQDGSLLDWSLETYRFTLKLALTSLSTEHSRSTEIKDPLRINGIVAEEREREAIFYLNTRCGDLFKLEGNSLELLKIKNMENFIFSDTPVTFSALCKSEEYLLVPREASLVLVDMKSLEIKLLIDLSFEKFKINQPSGILTGVLVINESLLTIFYESGLIIEFDPNKGRVKKCFKASSYPILSLIKLNEIYYAVSQDGKIYRIPGDLEGDHSKERYIKLFFTDSGPFEILKFGGKLIVSCWNGNLVEFDLESSELKESLVSESGLTKLVSSDSLLAIGTFTGNIKLHKL